MKSVLCTPQIRKTKNTTIKQNTGTIPELSDRTVGAVTVRTRRRFAGGGAPEGLRRVSPNMSWEPGDRGGGVRGGGVSVTLLLSSSASSNMSCEPGDRGGGVRGGGVSVTPLPSLSSTSSSRMSLPSLSSSLTVSSPRSSLSLSQSLRIAATAHSSRNFLL
jgi:hypothetical protein